MVETALVHSNRWHSGLASVNLSHLNHLSLLTGHSCAHAGTHTPRPRVFGKVANGFRSNKDLWLWVPAFAGTTNSMARSRAIHCHRFKFQTAAFFADTTSRSRGLIYPRFARNFLALQSEGAGNAGRPMRPLPRVRGIPRAMVLTAYFALSPATGLFCHRHPRNCFRELDTSVGASGPHDFAVRVSALRPKAHQRPPHPAPRS